MTELQVAAFVTSLVLILGVAAAAQWRWLGEGRAKTVVVFLAGAGAMAALAAGGLPPSWFSGSAAAFSLGATFTVSAFLGSPAERSFRRPFCLGMGLVLLSVNAVQAARNVL
jgi:hypothetical protein